MTTLKYSVPSIGEKNTVAEPKVDTALSEIKTVVNGEINNENIKEEGIEKKKLSAALQAELASFVGLPLESKKSIIATEETREATSYGTLTTPDEVEVVMATNGLIAISYQAVWKSSVESASRAAIFMGVNQLKTAVDIESAPNTQAARFGSGAANVYRPLFSWVGGLGSGEKPASEYSGDITTGQLVGSYGTHVYTELNANPVVFEASSSFFAVGGPCYVFAAAGTYKISVKFKATSGKVTAKNRKLWAWAIG
jgi:hypothetical protein